jgi:hypothetical protein
MEASGQLHVLADWPPGKGSPYILGRKLLGPHGRTEFCAPVGTGTVL